MDLTSRLDGYLNHQIAYPNPIPILPVPKTLHDKKDTTLLQMAMKAFLKQRLYGRFQNFNKDNTLNRNHMKSGIFAQKYKNSRISSSFEQTDNKKIMQIIKRDKNYSVLQPLNNEYNSKVQKSKSMFNKQLKNDQQIKKDEHKRLSQISSSYDFKSKKVKQSEYSHSFNIRRKSKINQNNQQDINVGTSFISSIQYFQKSKQSSEQKHQNENIKLPFITDKRKSNIVKPNLIKSPKVLFKKQFQTSVSVNDQLWSLLSKSKLQKSKRIKQRKRTQNKQSISTSINNSSIKYLDQSSQNKNSSMQKSVVDTLLFSKEEFNNFIGNSKLSNPSFVMSILAFFQLINKFSDRCNKRDFQGNLQNIFSQLDRAWCVGIFRYLDINLDGKIDSSDLFKIHNSLQQMIQVIQNTTHNNNSLQKVNQQTSFIDYNNKQQKKKKYKRQQTISSQNEQSINKLQKSKNLIRNKNKQTKQQTDQSQKYNDQFNQITLKLMNKNLNNLKNLQKQIQNLNFKIIQKDLIIKNINNQSLNPQSNNQRQQKHEQNEQKNDPVYLQQGLLKNKDLKISDLSMILNQLSNKQTKTKKKVIDIDYKNLNIKLSSSYVQTFIATNHNQQTRLNRQYMQGLKESIRKDYIKCNKQSSNLQKNTLPTIRYPQFYQQKLFTPFKNIFFSSIHTDIIQPK